MKQVCVVIMMLAALGCGAVKRSNELRAVAHTVADANANRVWNTAIQNLKVQVDRDQGLLKVQFRWYQSKSAGFYPHTAEGMLIRVFDKNGNCLTYFTTESLASILGGIMAVPEGDQFTLEYRINAKDAEYAESVEVGVIS